MYLMHQVENGISLRPMTLADEQTDCTRIPCITIAGIIGGSVMPIKKHDVSKVNPTQYTMTSTELIAQLPRGVILKKWMSEARRQNLT